MKLPSDLERKFEEAAGGEAGAVARAMYDIRGNLGETYVVANDNVLALFSKRCGGRHKMFHYALTDIGNLGIDESGTYSFLHISIGDESYKLNFSSWDSVELEDIGELWKAATGNLTTNAGAPVQSPSEPTGEVVEATPLIVFCASVYSMMEIDGHVEKGEMLALAEAVPDASAIDQGIRYFQQNGIHHLLEQAGLVLNGDQQRCLMANLIGVAMEDGLLRSAEQQALGSYRQALGIHDDEYNAIFEVLMNKNNVAVLAEGGGDGVSPLTAFFASLCAMAGADDEFDQGELDVILRIVDDPAPYQEGSEYLSRVGVDGLLEQIGGVMDEQQGLCLMSNLIAVAMADGKLRGAEQAKIVRFRSALGISDAAYDAIFNALMLKNNLSVFA